MEWGFVDKKLRTYEKASSGTTTGQKLGHFIPCLFDFINCARKITSCPSECQEVKYFAK
jgi:hypothetical protein